MTDAERELIDHPPTAKELFENGRREFFDGHYFEAHDIWEEFWHRLHGPDRRYLQGMIHLAVGAYHFENGNETGARSQWMKAVLKLGEYPKDHWGVDVSTWVQWIGGYLNGAAPGPHPKTLPFQSDRFPVALKMALD